MSSVVVSVRRIFVLLILTFSGTHSQETSLEVAFRQHFENVMAGYDTWLSQTNDADPTPLAHLEDPYWLTQTVHTRRVSTSLFDLTLRLDTEQMLGYVNNVQSRVVGDISADLSRFMFSVPIRTEGSIVFHGTYTAEGFLGTHGKPPITGSGAWNFTCTSLYQVMDLYFGIDENGFISFARNSYRFPEISLDVDYDKTHFEGLWDSVPASYYAEEFRKHMTLAMQDRYQYWHQDHPSGALLLRYLNETMANTRVEQILGIPY